MRVPPQIQPLMTVRMPMTHTTMPARRRGVGRGVVPLRIRRPRLALVRMPRSWAVVVFVTAVRFVMIVIAAVPVMMCVAMLGCALRLMAAEVAAMLMAVGGRGRGRLGRQAALVAQLLARRLLVVVLGAAPVVVREPSPGRLLVHMAE